MTNKKDYYETLGVKKTASDSELKSAYRKLAKEYHPDANPNNPQAEAKFKELSEAYAILSDGEKRAAYDRYGHSAFEGAAGGGAAQWSNINFEDIFGDIFGGGGGFGGFGDIFGGGGRRRTGPRRGADLQMRMQIKFEEAVFGGEKEIQLPTMDTCKTCKGTGSKPGTYPENCHECNGSGEVRTIQQTLLGAMQTVRPCPVCKGEGKIIKNPCGDCRGQGKVKVTKTLKVVIPKGIDNDQSIRLTGKGEPGEKGGPAGDLFIVMQVMPHKHFARQGNNLYLDVPITFVQAALGDEILVPLLDGSVEKYAVKPGTQPGTKAHLKGKGVPSVRNNRNVGDLIVTLNVAVPTHLTGKQREALAAFDESMGEDYKNHKKNFFDKIKESFK